MRMPIVILLVALWSPQLLADDADDAGAKLYEYFEFFNLKDKDTIANEIYSTPVHIGGGDSHRVLSDPAAAVANLTSLYEQLDTEDWVESRISDLKVCVLSATLALVDTRYSRLKSNGDPIPPDVRTTLYVVQKIDSDWRIVAFYGHSIENRPTCP